MTLAGVVLCCLLLGAAGGVRLPGAIDEFDLDYSDFPPLPPGMDPPPHPWYRSADQEDGSGVSPGSQHVVSVLCLSLSVCIGLRLSHFVCLSGIRNSDKKNISVSVSLFFSMSLPVFVSVSLSLSRSLALCLCLSLSVCLSVCLSVYLSLSRLLS